MLAAASNEKVFNVHPNVMFGRVALMSVALWFAPVVMMFSGEPVHPLLCALFGSIWAIALGVFAWGSRVVQLVVTPEGITYRAIGMTVSSTWDNIERIDTRIIYGDGAVEGLVLREPGMQMSAFVGGSLSLLRMTWQYWRLARTMDTYRTFIPISSLQTGNWRGMEIGTEIYRYAPHLFQ